MNVSPRTRINRMRERIATLPQDRPLQTLWDTDPKAFEEIAVLCHVTAAYLRRCLSRSGKVSHGLMLTLEQFGIRMETLIIYPERKDAAPKSKTPRRPRAQSAPKPSQAGTKQAAPAQDKTIPRKKIKSS